MQTTSEIAQKMSGEAAAAVEDLEAPTAKQKHNDRVGDPKPSAKGSAKAKVSRLNRYKYMSEPRNKKHDSSKSLYRKG